MPKNKSIRVSEEFHDRLFEVSRKDEDYEDTLRRLIGWGDGDGDGDGPSFGIKP